jgi:hypothetical protein
MVPSIVNSQSADMDSRNVGNAKLTGTRPATSHAPKIKMDDRIFRDKALYRINATRHFA